MVTGKLENKLNKNLYIGILGGSFDPPHEGHVNISTTALTKMKLNEIWWIVTSKNPFKSKSSLFSKRYRETRDYVSDKNIKIIKLDEKKSEFTIDTVLYLKKKYPNYNFIWLMGSDNLIELHKWKSWKEIFYNIPIAIFDRPLYSFILTKFRSLVYFRKEKVSKSLIKKFKNFEPPAWIFIDGLANFQSSTKIRNKSS